MMSVRFVCCVVALFLTFQKSAESKSLREHPQTLRSNQDEKKAREHAKEAKLNGRRMKGNTNVKDIDLRNGDQTAQLTIGMVVKAEALQETYNEVIKITTTGDFAHVINENEGEFAFATELGIEIPELIGLSGGMSGSASWRNLKDVTTDQNRHSEDHSIEKIVHQPGTQQYMAVMTSEISIAGHKMCTFEERYHIDTAMREDQFCNVKERGSKCTKRLYKMAWRLKNIDPPRGRKKAVYTLTVKPEDKVEVHPIKTGETPPQEMEEVFWLDRMAATGKMGKILTKFRLRYDTSDSHFRYEFSYVDYDYPNSVVKDYISNKVNDGQNGKIVDHLFNIRVMAPDGEFLSQFLYDRGDKSDAFYHFSTIGGFAKTKVNEEHSGSVEGRNIHDLGSPGVDFDKVPTGHGLKGFQLQSGGGVLYYKYWYAQIKMENSKGQLK